MGPKLSTNNTYINNNDFEQISSTQFNIILLALMSWCHDVILLGLLFPSSSNNIADTCQCSICIQHFKQQSSKNNPFILAWPSFIVYRFSCSKHVLFSTKQIQFRQCRVCFQCFAYCFHSFITSEDPCS